MSLALCQSLPKALKSTLTCFQLIQYLNGIRWCWLALCIFLKDIWTRRNKSTLGPRWAIQWLTQVCWASRQVERLSNSRIKEKLITGQEAPSWQPGSSCHPLQPPGLASRDSVPLPPAQVCPENEPGWTRNRSGENVGLGGKSGNLWREAKQRPRLLCWGSVLTMTMGGSNSVDAASCEGPTAGEQGLAEKTVRKAPHYRWEEKGSHWF